jgi:hypothetical protein
VEEAHGENRHAARAQLAHGAPRVRLVERSAHATVGENPLGHLGDEAPRHQRGGLLDLEVVDLVPLLAADHEHVAEPARGEEAHAPRLALDDDVRAERGAVHGLGDVAPGHRGSGGRVGAAARPREEVVEAGEAGLRGVGIGREPLGGGELARGGLQDEVGERAAHVERDAVRHDYVRRSDLESTTR